MQPQFLHDLVVIRTHGTELCMKIRQFGVIVHQRLVHLQHLERLPEEVRFEENRLATTTTNDPAVVAMLIECTRTLRKLKTRLDEPLVAETYLTGKRGINQAQKEYQKLNNNKSRNKL